MAAELINRVFGLGVRLDNIEQLLIDNVSVAYSKANTPDDWYMQLIDYCAKYRERFPYNMHTAKKTEHLGLMQYKYSRKKGTMGV